MYQIVDILDATTGKRKTDIRSKNRIGRLVKMMWERFQIGLCAIMFYYTSKDGEWYEIDDPWIHMCETSKIVSIDRWDDDYIVFTTKNSVYYLRNLRRYKYERS